MEVAQAGEAMVALHQQLQGADSESTVEELVGDEQLEMQLLCDDAEENETDFPEFGPHSPAARLSWLEAVEKMAGRQFTMAEFREAWRIVKLAGPFPFPFVFRCEDGVTRWLLPPGNAQGCELAETRSRTLSLLYSGVGSFFKPVVSHNPHRLFEQEEYVYRLEMRSAVRRAVEQLFKVSALPRCPGHAETSGETIGSAVLFFAARNFGVTGFVPCSFASMDERTN